jgi:hypothetical protein
MRGIRNTRALINDQTEWSSADFVLLRHNYLFKPSRKPVISAYTDISQPQNLSRESTLILFTYLTLGSKCTAVQKCFQTKIN